MAGAFVLNTDTVESVSERISSLATTVEPALSSAKEYSVDESDFDFSPAINAIKTNMQNVYDKVKISSDILVKVVATHSNLQNSLSDDNSTSTSSNNNYGSYYSTSPTSYSGSYSSGGPSSTSSSPTAQTTPSIVVTPTEPEKFDLAKLIKDGTIEILKEEELEEKTKDKTRLIIRINKNDANYEKYLEMVYKVAKLYGIAVAIVLIPDSEEDKTVKVSLVKGGKEEASIEGEITEEKLKKMFENAPDNVKADFKKENEFVYYKQGDYGQAYAGETIAAAGCGPTSAAMVLTYLTGDKVTPPEACSYSTQHGFASNGNGTYEALFPSIGQAYGLKVVKQSQTANNILNSLNDGNVIIAHMGPGEFTKGGHYIVLRKTDGNGNVLVADPANPARNKWYPASIFEQQASGSIYSFSV